jgi:hypothetical protein
MQGVQYSIFKTMILDGGVPPVGLVLFGACTTKMKYEMKFVVLFMAFVWKIA